ncbi:RNA polymerase sigma factor [Peribacillus loiseleuriae]|uniref:RNA polymerase sigma factor n=1 Tax=Peribacillus loiseleuriae TaxID=1679170 RepID=UPI003CFD9786
MEKDEQLIKRIVAGEQDQFRELISRYQVRVFAVAYKVSKSTKDAEDITQEVFLQLYRSLSQFKGDSSLSTWIYKIAMSKALDYRRKQIRQVACEGEENLYDIPFGATPEDHLLEKEDKELARAYMEKLPDTYKEVVHLYYFRQQSYREIASTLNVAVKTVESRLYRAKLIMKKQGKGEGL